MARRLLLILLVAVISQWAYCQDDGQYVPEDGFDNDQEPPLDAPEEGSGAHGLGGSASDVPLIDEADSSTPASADDAIQCPADLCTCSQAIDGDGLNLTVDCSSKELTELPAGIDKRVKFLYLQNNKLTKLPKAISEFRELEELNVNDNSIMEFDFGSASELPNLRVLKAANNRLLEFPKELKNALDLRSLQTLDLGRNDMRETLTADHFTHMESITDLTLPVSTHELIEELCHHLGATLRKICINDCSVNIEDCANYAEASSELISAPSAEVIESQAENNEEVVPEESEDVIPEESVGEVLSEPNIEEVPLPDPGSNDGVEQTNLVNEENEVVDETTPTATTPDNAFNADSPPSASGDSTIQEFQSTVNNENDKSIIPIKLSSGAAILDEPAVAGAPADPQGTLTNTDGNNAGAVKIQSAGVADDTLKQMTVDAETDEVEGAKVGATSVKQGGGIDSSVIALIVAGMVIVVAGVTIKKNWSSIKNRFRSSRSPANAPDSAQTNGTSPEEVPLQDKSMV